LSAYFSESYSHVRLASRELRRAQVGAIHSIAAHFTLQERPAIVVLPTGTGKTAVLMLTPYVLQAERALIITPSRFVRNQIAQDFKTLRTLKQVGAIAPDLPVPSIYENKRRIRSDQAWNDLVQYDAVVSLPNSASPAYKDIPNPPQGLFDIILIDEAHHSPATTWYELIAAFPGTRSVLFTATPFRRDGKEIKGRHVYTYPIQRAFEDDIFGEMVYIPVEAPQGVSPDIALALETERVFNEDSNAGFVHTVMVRANSRSRADELGAIYREHTALKLEVIHSGKNQKATEEIVQRLREGTIQGVITVNMLGEGFDLPNLKIAALHAPHRSLAVTLQFFGRFARVSGERLGDAKFLAIQSEVHGEIDELFQETEAWGKKIRILGQAKIGEEIAIQEFIDEFRPTVDVQTDATLEDLSLYSFNLLNHVKVYRVHGEVDLDATPALYGFTTVKAWVNDTESTAAFLAREEIRPKWTQAESLARIEYHLFITYYDKCSDLLFICATYREETVYKEIADIFVDGAVQPLSLSRINRVLRSFSELELFNIGMRNRATGTVVETYRQLAGSAVHGAIEKEDGLLYHRGHIFGKGRTASGVTTIGLSSLSKIWRLEHTKVPGLVRWCQQMARDIENPAPFTTGIALDHLDTGQEITEIPDEIVLAADWQEGIYRTPPLVRFNDSDGAEQRAPLLDFDLLVDWRASSKETILVDICIQDVQTRLAFSIVPYPLLRYIDDLQPRWCVERGYRSLDLVDYLNANSLRFHLANGSLLEGCQLFDAPENEVFFDTDSLMHPVDWQGVCVDITQEYGTDSAPLLSIHDWLEAELTATSAEVVFYDHRAGECADFVVIDIDMDGQSVVKLYHCKKSGGSAPGDRVDDLYEVCGQAVKSIQWRSKKRLIDKVKHRAGEGSRFCKGDLQTFLSILEPDLRLELPLKIYVVQPGVPKSTLTPKMSALLATASRGLTAAGCQRLQVICSN